MIPTETKIPIFKGRRFVPIPENICPDMEVGNIYDVTTSEGEKVWYISVKNMTALPGEDSPRFIKIIKQLNDRGEIDWVTPDEFQMKSVTPIDKIKELKDA
jgi:hypothetical protein